MSQVLGLRILSTAQALPARIVSTAEAAALCGMPPEIAVKRTGVHERRWLSGSETALTLGAQAAREAVAAAGLEVAQIDTLLNASGSQLQPIPDGAALFARELGLRGSSTYSIHGTCLSFAQPESALLIGDGAAAVVVGPATRDGQGIHAIRVATYPEGADHTRIRGGGSLLSPRHPDAVPTDFTFDLHGLSVLRLASQVVPDFLETLRPGLSTGLPGIDRVIPHQASAAGLDLMRRYGWPAEQTEVTLTHLGNVIAASLPLTLHQALTSGRAGEGDTLLFAGTGAGLIAGGMILRL